MNTATAPAVGSGPAAPPRRTVADLLRELGDVPAHRVRLHPPPGTATEADAVWVNEHEQLCELIDGTLVETAVSVPESYLATVLISFLMPFVRVHKLGIVTAPDAQYRMLRGNIRQPDVSFTRKDRLPNPVPQVGGWCPDLCVEILSPDNTPAEMARKREEYFKSGCQLVWLIDPRGRAVDVFTMPAASTRLTETDTLDGGAVLPGFVLPLAELFAAFDDGMQPTT